MSGNGNELSTIWGVWRSFLEGLSRVWDWLSTPFLGDFAPIHIVAGAGLVAVLAVLVVHFVNPTS